MAVITINLEEQEKLQLEELIKNMGLNLSTFFQIYTKRVLHDRKIPFEIIALDNFYSAENLEKIELAEKQVKEGKIVIKTIEELEAM